MVTAGDPNRILANLAVPLKDKLLRQSTTNALLEGSQTPIRLLSRRNGSAEQVLLNDAFCIGRLQACEVQLDMCDLNCSRISLCVFNLPGSIVVVDGWSCSGSTLQVDGELMMATSGSQCLFLVPHGKTAILQISHEKIIINPRENNKFMSL